MNRKEREKQFKKQEIKNAALELFAKKGYKATTLDEIAAKSEFGKGTIYNYFSSKEDIYTEIIVSTIQQHKILIEEVDKNSSNLTDFVERLLTSLTRFSYQNKEAFLLLLFTEIHQSYTASTGISKIMDKNKKELEDFFIKKTKEAIKKKEIRDINPIKVIRLFRGIGYNYIYDLMMSNELKEENIVAEAKFISDILFNGIKY